MSEWRALTKARKIHWCEICRNEIAKGELYVRYDCTPWGHPDNEGYHTYRCCRFCDHMHYDVLDIQPVDGYSDWDETVEATRHYFFGELKGILPTEIDLETYAHSFSQWTLSGGPFERCVAHPGEELQCALPKLRRCSRCAVLYKGIKARGFDPQEFMPASEWNAAQRFYRQYPRYLPEPISYELALDLLKERHFNLTDPDRVTQVLTWYGDTENVRKAIAELRGAI